MKIQNELLTGAISDPQQLKKTNAPKNPEAAFSAFLEEELTAGGQPVQTLPGILNTGNIANLANLAPIQQTAAFSPEENKAMDDISEILDMVDLYSSALAGLDGQGQENLKRAYSILENVSDAAAKLKNSFAGLADNPVLAGIVNELDVMTATEKFKINRGDYLA